MNSFVAGSSNGTCGSVDEDLPSLLEMSWFIDLEKYYSVETVEIKTNISDKIYLDIYDVCYDLHLILYAYRETFL